MSSVFHSVGIGPEGKGIARSRSRIHTIRSSHSSGMELLERVGGGVVVVIVTLLVLSDWLVGLWMGDGARIKGLCTVEIGRVRISDLMFSETDDGRARIVPNRMENGKAGRRGIWLSWVSLTPEASCLLPEVSCAKDGYGQNQSMSLSAGLHSRSCTLRLK